MIDLHGNFASVSLTLKILNIFWTLIWIYDSQKQGSPNQRSVWKMQYIELIVIWALLGNLTERNKDWGLEPVAKLIYNCYSLNTRENENVIRKRWKNILRYWIEFYNGILYIFLFPASFSEACGDWETRGRKDRIGYHNKYNSYCLQSIIL